ncbi:hypothetical protein ACFQY4_13920 [Catellatospora bangladeshensis]|uniref:hypothetical protein n=1 Tax=Catellatospora bangladeshensis TaxID=310355 RepID=UPI0031FA2B34
MAETSLDTALHRSLTWPDVDPARNPFDRTAAAGIVRAIVSAVPVDADHGQRDGWRDEISRLLVAAFGIWAREWCWSPSPGSWHGGRVAAWCCTKHSVASAEENQACVSASLLDWRDWLEELAERFDRLLPDPNLAPTDLLVAWEAAIADLAHAASGRMARDGWYGYFTWALCWLRSRPGKWCTSRRPSLILG